MNRVAFDLLKTFFLYLALNAAAFLMLRVIVPYFALDDHVGFLQVKQAYLPNKVWKFAFYVHVFSSFLTLAAGFTQFSTEFLGKGGRVHRLVGKIYAYDILCVNFPAAFVMAVYANGGLPSKVAFLTLDSLWFWFTLRAVVAVRRGDVAGHRDDMTRSYALTLSAISLRSWRLILSSAFPLSPETIYMIDAWLGFVPNLLCAEWLIARRRAPSSVKEGRVKAGGGSEEDRHERHQEDDQGGEGR